MSEQWDWPTDDRRIIIEFHRDMGIRDETVSRIWEAVSEFISTEFGPISFGCRVEGDAAR